MHVTAQDIAAAATAIAPHIVRTPTVESRRLGELLGTRLHLKLENMQFTGSFKDRGACNKLQQLAAAGGVRGVIAASAGNHAQGVAYHAQRLGMPATIVMPQTTPFAKVERTASFGAKVVLQGESLAESATHARELEQAQGLVYVHPYDDPAIIAGQGTAAMELFADRPDLDTLVVPIGGGGLISGMAIWAKSVQPRLRVIGVQTEQCPAMRAKVRGETPPPFGTLTLADGIAVKQPGEITSRIVAQLVDEILLVGEDDLENAVQLLATQQKVVAEGAGAAGIAAMLRHPSLFANRHVGVVVCGGNIDRRMLSTVLLRTLKRDGKVAKLRIEIRDVPGVLSRVTQMIGAEGADIIDIEHQRLFNNLGPRHAELDVVMETHGTSHVARILETLRGAGFPARPM
jgi:threonine dehydratase